jgi:hypothetical protein
MKVYMRYIEAGCGNGKDTCRLCSDYDPHEFSLKDLEEFCARSHFIEDSRKISIESDIIPQESCHVYYYKCIYRYSITCVMCKDAKNIEIVIPHSLDEDGYVKIGRKYYSLADIDLLKVDYGEGYVQEWPESEDSERESNDD